MKNIILSIFFAFVGTICLIAACVFSVIGFVNYLNPAPQYCPLGMTCYPTEGTEAHERSLNFIVVDSVGRRYRPVPCRCEEDSHKGCGDLYTTDECDILDSAQQKVSIIYPNGRRRKKCIFEVEDYTPPCGDKYRPNFRLERITHETIERTRK